MMLGEKPLSSVEKQFDFNLEPFVFYGFKGTATMTEVNSVTIIRFKNTCVEEYKSNLETGFDSFDET